MGECLRGRRNLDPRLDLRLNLVLDRLGLELLRLVLLAEPGVEADVDVRHPNHAEKGNDIANPAGRKEFVAGEVEENGGYVVAETIRAGKQIKEFPFPPRCRALNLPFAVFPRLPKDLFLCKRPGDARDRNRQ